MPLTKSEEAQYNAMQSALIEGQETIQKLRLEKQELHEKLNKIMAIINDEESE